MPRSSFLLALLVGLAAAPVVQAQQVVRVDTVRVDSLVAPPPGYMALPMPVRGELFVRYGPPGSVAVLGGAGGQVAVQVPPTIVVMPDGTQARAVAPTPGAAATVEVPATSSQSATAQTAANQALLNRLDAMNRRLAELERDLAIAQGRPVPERTIVQQAPSRDRDRTVVVPTPVPTGGGQRTVVDTVFVQDTTRAVFTLPRLVRSDTTQVQALPTARVQAPIITVSEVERSILETGVFRSLSVYFETGRAQLFPSSLETLEAIGEVLLRYPDLRIEIGGHTDNVGSEQTNQRLSLERAQAVRAWMLSRFPAIEPERIEAQGYGEAYPIAENTNPTGRTLNRRVEFTLLNPEAAERIRRTSPFAPTTP